MKTKISLSHLKDELNQLRKKNTQLKEDAAFVLWFLQAYLVDSLEQAKKALTGDTGDKNIDAIYIDDKAKQVHIIQGKLRQSETKKEKRNDVLSFADLCNLPWKRRNEVEAFFTKLDPLVAQKLDEAIKRIRQNKYELQLYYVTTGKCSSIISNEARECVRHANGASNIHIIDYDRVLLIFKNCLDDITPHVPTLKLRIVPDGAISNEGVIRRFDPTKRIESWIFTVSGNDIGDMYSRVGRKLFARNIRGYLEKTDPNESMQDTIKKEPYNFWYYNNGITMVCDEAKREMQGGEDVLIIDGAQVINGQQTTRTLSKEKSSKGTNVLIKVIKIPRNPNDDIEYDQLVNSIVRATNLQNHILPSDLVSNDFIQVYLEKEFRKRDYQYIRKRMSKSEARSYFGRVGYQIKKDELAQAIAACLFDPSLLRKGKENLFEDPYYKTIFSSRSISFYLSKYWLMKQVQYAARGYPERSYAKWLVLNFAWTLLGGEINSGNGERKFRYACEHYERTITYPVYYLLVGIFRASLKFYRTNRGKGESATDISTFFKRSKLDSGFQKFWNSNKNNYRNKTREYSQKIKIALKELDIDE